jgi:tripartite-type tricarboxylate transporter receptor subunit TctC
MKNGMSKALMFTLLLILCSIGILVREARTQAKLQPEAFYKGAMIKFIVPYAPGGTYDLYARMLGPYLEKYTGSRVIIENMAGAAGLVGGGYLYSVAKPDGLTVALLPMPGMIIGDLLDIEGVKYELDKFTYVGRVETVWRGLFTSKASGFKSIQDMMKAAKPIRFGSTDPTAQSSVDASLIAEAFHLRAKIVPGYKGSKEYMLALIAGREVDAAATNFTGYEEFAKKGEIILAAMIGKQRYPDFPGTPYLLETPGLSSDGKRLLEILYVTNEAGRMMVAPSKVPEAKRSFLETALAKAMKEPALMDWAQKNGFNMSFLPGKECQEMISKLMGVVPKADKPRIKNLVTQKYF